MTETKVSEKGYDYSDKIAKLLINAEKAPTPEAAEAFTEKAQRLMTEYGITLEMIAIAQGKEIQDHVVEERIAYTGIFHMAKYEIGKSIATHNDCKHLIGKNGNSTTLYVIGFSKDVERVKLLDASLQIQAVSAMTAWSRTINHSWMTPMQWSKERRGYLLGWANGMSAKLQRARQAGLQDAAQGAVDRKDAATMDDARKSTELVVVSKKEKVDQWVDEQYGKSLRTVRSRYSWGSGGSHGAGYRDGQNANTGQTNLGRGTRGAIGS